MKIIKLLFVCLLLLCGQTSCESPTEINSDTGQIIYNDVKGNYTGTIVINNIPQKISMSIGNDLTIKQFPTEPILRRIFNSTKELDEALESSQSITFIAPVKTMTVSGGFSYLEMEPTDLVFDIIVNGKTSKVSALMEPVTRISLSTYELSLNMAVKELSYNGVSYDMKTNGIVYIVDNAQKERE